MSTRRPRRVRFRALLQHRQAGVQIACGEMGVAHRHLERLMSQPCLHAPQVYPASHQPRGAGVPQDVRHDVGVVAEAAFLPGRVPDDPELMLLYVEERPPAGRSRGPQHPLHPVGERNGPAPAGLGDPERHARAVDVVPSQSDGLAEAGTRIDQEDGQAKIVLGSRPDRLEQRDFLLLLQEPDSSRPLLQALDLGGDSVARPSCAPSSAAC